MRSGFSLPAREDPASQPLVTVAGDIYLEAVLVEGAGAAPGAVADEMPAGAAASALALAALGARVSLVGAVGDDAASRRLQQVLDEAGVDTAGLLLRDDRPVQVRTRMMGGGRQLATMDGERQELTQEEGDKLLRRVMQSLDRARALVVIDAGLGSVQPLALKSLRSAALASGVIFLLDRRPAGTEEAGGEATGGESLRRAMGQRLGGPPGGTEALDLNAAGDAVSATLAWGLAAELESRDVADLADLILGCKRATAGGRSVSRATLERALLPEAGLLDKIVTREELPLLLQERRRDGCTVVFTNGCFDIMHAGHLRVLSRCAVLGDTVVVGLNSDRSVRALKGAGRPIVGEQDRALMLAALGAVSLVVLFDEDTPAELVRELQPDVLVKGGDYSADGLPGWDTVKARGGRLDLVDLRDGISTTEIMRRILETSRDGPAGR